MKAWSYAGLMYQAEQKKAGKFAYHKLVFEITIAIGICDTIKWNLALRDLQNDNRHQSIIQHQYAEIGR